MNTTSKQAADFDAFCRLQGVERYHPNSEFDALFVAAKLKRFRSAMQTNLDVMLRDGKPIDLEIGFVADASLNAWAASYNGTYLIGLNRGLNMRIGMALVGMIADGRAFPGLGKQYFDGPFHFPSDFLRYSDLGTHIPFPDDEELLRLVMQISDIAELFLVFHELAHIKNGHVDWYNDRFGLTAVDEKALQGPSPVAPIIRQTIEWDADCVAIGTLFRGQIDIQLHKIGRPGDTLAGPRIPEIADVISRVMFGLWAVYKLFEPRSDVPDDIDSVLSDLYPPPRYRATFAIAMMHSVLIRSCGADPSTYHDDVTQSVLRAETAWHAMTREAEGQVFSEDAYATGGELLQRYNACWSEIHPELDRFKLGAKLAPAMDEWTFEHRS